MLLVSSKLFTFTSTSETSILSPGSYAKAGDIPMNPSKIKGTKSFTVNHRNDRYILFSMNLGVDVMCHSFTICRIYAIKSSFRSNRYPNK